MKKRYYNLSLYRLLAIFLVLQFHIFFICHTPDLGLWTLLSKGMQGLAVLSGFLLSQKVITSVKDYYLSRAKKLLIPMVAVLIVILLWNILYMLITRNYDFPSTFFGYTASNHRFLIEFGNFYYIAYILVCYLIAPLLKKNKWWKYVFLGLALIVEGLTCLFTNPLFIASAFLIGYIVGELSFAKYTSLDSKPGLLRYILWPTLLVGFLALSIYLFKLWWWTPEPLKLLVYNFSLSAFGVSTFFTLVVFTKFLNKFENNPFLDFTDKYTYYVFLFNQTFMCGAMDVSSYVDTFINKLLLVNSFVIVFSIITFLATKYVIKGINCKKQLNAQN